MINSTPEHNRMYQIIEGEVAEVVRRGDVIMPITDLLASEIVGQQVLKIWSEDEDIVT